MCRVFSVAPKSGGAPPHSKTQAKLPVRNRGHVLECDSVLPLLSALVGLRSKTSLNTYRHATAPLDRTTCTSGASHSEAATTVASNHSAAGQHLCLLAPPHRRKFHHVLRIVIDQLEPVFRHIRRRENIVLHEFGDERKLQIVFADSGGRLL